MGGGFPEADYEAAYDRFLSIFPICQCNATTCCCATLRSIGPFAPEAGRISNPEPASPSGPPPAKPARLCTTCAQAHGSRPCRAAVVRARAR